MQHTLSAPLGRKTSNLYYQGVGALLLASLPLVAQASWPVATPDSVVASTSQLITIPVLQNDTGTGLELIEVNSTTQGLGSASINTDRQSVTYQSASGYSGEDVFWYAFEDSEGRTNAAKVTVNVTAGVTKPIEWPTASDDSAETTVDTSIEIDVLDNDSGFGLTLTEVNTTTVKLGQASISSDGKTINYTPATGYTGADEFWYVFSDNWGRTNAGKITLSVKDNESAPYTGWPVAEADSAETINTATVVIPVLDNDRGQSLSLVEVNEGTKEGGKTHIEGSKVRYAPPVGFSGEDSFWYAFKDDQGRTNSTKVTVTVEANTANSTVAFCGANYSTDGTKAGTFLTQEEIETGQRVMGFSASRNYQADNNGLLTVVGNNRYYIEKTDTTSTFWVDNGNTKTALVTGNEDLNITRISSLNGTLYYRVILDSELFLSKSNNNEFIDPEDVGLSFHSHDGIKGREITVPNGINVTSLFLMNNPVTPYFFSAGTNTVSGQSVTYYFRLNDDGSLVKVASAQQWKQVGALFYHNGLDYSYTKFSAFVDGIQRVVTNVLTQADNHIMPERVLTQFSASLTSSVTAGPRSVTLSNNRLLIVTPSHEEYELQESSGQYELSAEYPAKLFTVNTRNEFIELATCAN